MKIIFSEFRDEVLTDGFESDQSFWFRARFRQKIRRGSETGSSLYMLDISQYLRQNLLELQEVNREEAV